MLFLDRLSYILNGTIGTAVGNTTFMGPDLSPATPTTPLANAPSESSNPIAIDRISNELKALIFGTLAVFVAAAMIVCFVNRKKQTEATETDDGFLPRYQERDLPPPIEPIEMEVRQHLANQYEIGHDVTAGATNVTPVAGMAVPPPS
ncbi:hypothetical protein HDU97_004090 [Phlyctochytrium planicorne]|nr:hypothetical protein HDU97_004090 [Phlyctochytrium planicorne]